MKKVLIFGIDSFTGEYISSYLQKFGFDIYGTSYLENSLKKYKCDITNKDEIVFVLKEVEPNFIIHLSGITFAAHGNNEDFYKVNTIGTINILDTLLELNQNPEKIIIASSATIYGNQGLEILDESLCPMPANHYGASKYSMECLARGYFDKLPILITRPFNYTGAGQAEHFLIPKIVKHFKEKKETIELGNLEVSREFNDIEYVCEIYKKLLECDSKGEIVNISTNKAIKLLDVLKLMEKIAGYKIDVKINPLFIRKDEIETLTGSTKKLFGLIGNVKERDLINTLKNMYTD